MISEVKKVSLSSIQPNVAIKDITLNEKWKDSAPKDRFYIVHAIFFLLGLMHYIPYSFFLTANAYWMYKFRNVSAEITDTDARTTLQIYFSPGTTIANSLPGVIFTLASTFYGRKIKARLRVLGSLFAFTFCFVFMTGFIKINTDSWQLGFFILTMTVLSVICAGNSILEIATLSIISRFPQYYMKVYLMGQGFAGLFNSLLQIFSLATGTSTIASALIYFLVGSSLLCITSILLFCSKYNKCYNWHISSIKEDTARHLIPFSEMKSHLKIVWPHILFFTTILLTIVAVHTSITALVVSEDYGNGKPWNDTYFVPVITFMYTEATGILGRFACSKINKSVDGILLNILSIVRMFIFVPLLFLCNAQPRNHFPVVFPHDWQYIIILGAFSFTNGYTLTMVFLEVRKLVEPEKNEDVFMVFMSCIAIIAPLATPVSIFAVKLL